jgi:hypothetical protein
VPHISQQCGYVQYVPPQDAAANAQGLASNNQGVYYDVWRCWPYHPGPAVNLWLWLGFPALGLMFIVALVLLSKIRNVTIVMPKPYLWGVRRKEALALAMDGPLGKRLADLREISALQDKLSL